MLLLELPFYLQRLERSPVVSVVALDNVGQHRDGSRNCLGSDKSEDTDHCQTTVVDLYLEASGLGFLALVLGGADRVEKVQWDRVRKFSIEFGEFTNLVRLIDVGEPFEESNESDNLGLGRKWKGIPLGRRGKISGRMHVSVGGKGPREDEVALNNVSDKGGHGNTSVLDLGLSEESDGVFLVHAVKAGRSKVQRIPEFDKRVELGGQSFKVSLSQTSISIG